MARRRYLSTQISVDKSINQLATIGGDFAVMLYTWMIPHAGDDGRLTADPDEILMTVIPGRRDKSPEDVQTALEAMGSVGLIEWDGQYIAFPAESFYRYQTYIKPENRRQAPESSNGSDEPRPTPKNSDERRKTPQNAASVSPSFSPSVSSPVPVSPTASNDAVGRAAAPKKPRERDEVWDALAETTGSPATKNERSDFGETVAQLKDAEATVDEILSFPRWWYESFPGAKLTHRCYREHLGKFRSAPPKPPMLTDIKSSSMRSLARMSQEDYDAATRDIPAQNGRSGVLPAAARGLGSGERPPQRSLRSASERTEYG